MRNLDYNLFSKHTLRFDKNGKFKILMLSDIQETLNYDKRTLDSINKILDFSKPNLVVLGGDNCDGTVLKTKSELIEYLNIFSKPMENRKIPWMHVFGNHDHDIDIDDMQKTKIYEQYDYCISKHTEDIYGTTNYVLPIKHFNTDKIAFNIWAMDTNNLITNSNMEIDKNMNVLKKPSMSCRWDIIHFDQLMWYWNTSNEIEKYCNKRINGMLFMHIPPYEFQYIIDNPKYTNGIGSMVEDMKIGMFNSGIFSTILQRKDIKCIACGHSHNDCFQGEFCGIQMCLDACAGYSPYGTDALRGGRIFEINEKDTNSINTYMIHYKDI